MKPSILTFADIDPAPFPRGTINTVGINDETALRKLVEKYPALRSDFQTMGPEEYARAFTVAGTSKKQIVETIQEKLAETFQNRTGEKNYVKELEPILRDAGWLSSPEERADRLDLIFDTHLSAAQSAGRWQRIQRAKDIRPYLTYVATRDMRTRPNHMAMNGVTLPVDHPYWATHFPANGFRCRCDVIQLSERQMIARGGLTENIPSAQPDPGWAFNPGMLSQVGAQRSLDRINQMASTPPISPALTVLNGIAAWLGVSDIVDELLDRV